MHIIIKTILVGVGATFAMDIWSFILSVFNIKSLDYRFVGRWIGNMPNGQFFHKNISNSAPIKSELIIGWAAHYSIGICFAFLMLAIYGKSWFEKPYLFPALVIGITTIIAPFYLMQPAFGFGLAGANFPEPNSVRLKSFMAHLVYGIGLYATVVLINFLISKITS